MEKELETELVTDFHGAFLDELDALIQEKSGSETKYYSCVKLKKVELSVDERRAEKLDFPLPTGRIDEAERALRGGVLIPIELVEEGDDTTHKVILFEPTPTGYSGFVTYSLGMTDKGVFEIGRYPVIDFDETRPWQLAETWQWFIYSRLMTAEEINELQQAGESHMDIFGLVWEELMYYEELIGRELESVKL